MADCVTGLLIAGAAISLGGMSYESGCGLGSGNGAGGCVYGGACAPGPAVRPFSGSRSSYKGAGEYTYFAGYAPTPEYVSGTTYYGYSGTMVPAYAGVGYSSPYSAAATYYHY